MIHVISIHGCADHASGTDNMTSNQRFPRVQYTCRELIARQSLRSSSGIRRQRSIMIFRKGDETADGARHPPALPLSPPINAPSFSNHHPPFPPLFSCHRCDLSLLSSTTSSSLEKLTPSRSPVRRSRLESVPRGETHRISASLRGSRRSPRQIRVALTGDWPS